MKNWCCQKQLTEKDKEREFRSLEYDGIEGDTQLHLFPLYHTLPVPFPPQPPLSVPFPPQPLPFCTLSPLPFPPL